MLYLYMYLYFGPVAYITNKVTNKTIPKQGNLKEMFTRFCKSICCVGSSAVQWWGALEEYVKWRKQIPHHLWCFVCLLLSFFFFFFFFFLCVRVFLFFSKIIDIVSITFR